MQQKRNRARAIIIKDDSILTMYREFEDRVFYTFPGGGVEENETFEECVVRECQEELGIVVKPIKKLYHNQDKNGKSQYFLCEWVSGEFGTGNGEEYQKNNPGGVYIPTIIKLADIPSIPLMPPKIANKVYKEFKNK